MFSKAGNFEVEVGASTSSTVSDPSYGMSRFNPCTRYNRDLGEVTVAGAVAGNMLNHDASAMASIPPSDQDAAGRSALDHTAIFSGHIDAVVKADSFLQRICSGAVETGNAGGGQGPI